MGIGAAPLPVIKIVILWRLGGGGIGGRQNPTKHYGAPLSVIKMVKYCDFGGVGGIEGAKTYKYNGAPSLSSR